MKALKNLGINTVHIDTKEAMELGFARVELSLGRGQSYEEQLLNLHREIKNAEKLDFAYSIHLPVYMPSWYTYHCFSAFFIDRDSAKRELSFKLLEYNLERLKRFSPEYYVLHFPGIDSKWANQSDFENILLEALDRVDSISKKYNVKIYLEYFGSNKNFVDYNSWISTIEKYEKIGLLIDTGHLYFASIQNKFDFDRALSILSDSCDAFHIWTTKGDKAYCSSEYYQQYHHIAPNLDQRKREGWAFDTDKVIKTIASKNKPVIIEPSIKYGGRNYLLDGIRSIRKLFDVESNGL